MKIKRQLLILVLAGMMCLCGCSCGSKSSTAETTGPSQSGLPVIDVAITNSDENVVTVSSEVAVTSQEHQIGLMNRTSLEEDSGMLFVFTDERPRSFWMKNTLIPLDMIFIDSDKKIVDINRNSTPLSEVPYVSTGAAKYVLEVNGGYCSDHNINDGDTLSFAGY